MNNVNRSLALLETPNHRRNLAEDEMTARIRVALARAIYELFPEGGIHDVRDWEKFMLALLGDLSCADHMRNNTAVLNSGLNFERDRWLQLQNIRDSTYANLHEKMYIGWLPDWVSAPRSTVLVYTDAAMSAPPFMVAMSGLPSMCGGAVCHVVDLAAATHGEVLTLLKCGDWMYAGTRGESSEESDSGWECTCECGCGDEDCPYCSGDEPYECNGDCRGDYDYFKAGGPKGQILIQFSPSIPEPRRQLFLDFMERQLWDYAMKYIDDDAYSTVETITRKQVLPNCWGLFSLYNHPLPNRASDHTITLEDLEYELHRGDSNTLRYSDGDSGGVTTQGYSDQYQEPVGDAVFITHVYAYGKYTSGRQERATIPARGVITDAWCHMFFRYLRGRIYTHGAESLKCGLILTDNCYSTINGRRSDGRVSTKTNSHILWATTCKAELEFALRYALEKLRTVNVGVDVMLTKAWADGVPDSMVKVAEFPLSSNPNEGAHDIIGCALYICPDGNQPVYGEETVVNVEAVLDRMNNVCPK